MVQVKPKQEEAKFSLDPSIGKIGATLFFVLLFSLSEHDIQGYEKFRKCHSNCVNGICHAIGMPMAVSGVFMIVRAASDSAQFTRVIQTLVVTLYLVLYLQYEKDPISPWLFYILYLGILEFLLSQKLYKNEKMNRQKFLILGAALVAFNVGALETIGHGLFEHHHSYVLEFFNSVFHTPLYGINSVLLSSELRGPRDDHVCW